MTKREAEESEEEEDEVTFYLNQMVKAMERSGRANKEKNKKFDTLLQISFDQHTTNYK